MHSIRHTISLSHIKKVAAKSFAVLFSIGIILSNFNLSYAIADTIPYYGTTDPSYNEVIESGIFLGKSNNNTIYALSFGTNDNVYVGFIDSLLCFACKSTSATVHLVNYGNSKVYFGQNFDNTTEFYYTYWGSGNTFSDLTISSYNSLSDFLGSANTPDIPAYTYNFLLQNGWLSVIDFGTSGTSYDLTLNTSFAEYSHLSQPWWDSTQRYWFTDTMPAVGSTITNSETGILIPWDKTGNTDLFDRSKSAVASLSGTSSARYMVIYNPAYHMFNMFLSGNKTEPNLPVSISGIPQGSTISLFKMDESMHLTSGLTSEFISDAGSAVATGSALNITDSFVDNDGNSVVQNSGGANDIHESPGIISYIVAINDTLDNFTDQFVQLLSAPITHIQQLVISGSNFFTVFGSLFTWLPVDVYQIIIGAFVVMVVIGVIKLLL